jgi:hypothetical protein
VCDAVVSGILKRPMITHLNIDHIACENKTIKQYKMLSDIITKLPLLHTLTSNNTRHTSVFMNMKIAQLLAMIPESCTAVNLIYTYKAKYSGTLVAHTVPDHIKILSARNVKLLFTANSQLNTLHLDSCRNSKGLRLPLTLKELYVTNCQYYHRVCQC